MAEALPIIKPNTITGSSVRQRLRDTVPAGLAERLHRAYVPPTVCLSCAKQYQQQSSSSSSSSSSSGRQEAECSSHYEESVEDLHPDSSKIAFSWIKVEKLRRRMRFFFFFSPSHLHCSCRQKSTELS